VEITQGEAPGKRTRTQPDLAGKELRENVFTTSPEQQQKIVPRVSKLDKKVSEYIALHGLECEIKGKSSILTKIGDTDIYGVRVDIVSGKEREARIAELELSPKYGRLTLYDRQSNVVESIVQYGNTVSIYRPKEVKMA
jgi:hypothetical protein